ncbi:DNA recombination protein RmuC [Flavimarina sp. Hel_I_48]|uniref:DNA recombination protein RmuC n=1 Tax=Flavimarina sp. Hel_I_48 TaxID=1392488 RepID=UPI0004DECD21|nr:DNA recombination protein RmuC [Flavimarina sp. Hel_I_48]
MNLSFLSLIVASAALILGVLIGFLIANARKNAQLSKLTERLNLQALNLQKAERQLQDIQDEKNNLLSETSSIQQHLTRRTVELEHLKQRMTDKTGELEQLQARFTKDFELVASKILDEKSTKFTLQNKENIDNILKPLQEKINSFEKKVEDTNKESLGRHGELRQQIKGLAELNMQMSRDADNLTKALKGDSKMQGNWGEVILTRVLEKSGLEKDREYTIQDSHASENGRRLQTDVLIHLPDGKKMVVDSKVSLTAFERFVSEEDEDLKRAHLKQHIQSIKRHIDQLSAKNYPYFIEESPDTTFMFIPVEAAFAIASAHAPQLYEMAFDKQVIIVTPSTLLAALRLVENLWQNDKQKKNTLEIATQAGKLYDSFSTLTDELLKIDRQMGTVQNSFENALKKLTGKGNLVQRVEKLKRLGAKTSKSIAPNLLENLPQNHLKPTDNK